MRQYKVLHLDVNERVQIPLFKNVVIYHNMYKGSHNNKISMISKIPKLCNKSYYSSYFPFFQENNVLDRIRLIYIYIYIYTYIYIYILWS